MPGRRALLHSAPRYLRQAESRVRAKELGQINRIGHGMRDGPSRDGLGRCLPASRTLQPRARFLSDRSGRYRGR
jgi:hypothetical protein